MFKRTHKADYMAFNVALVKEVEKHPCLYDFHLKEYSSREIVQETWKTVANIFNCTAKECRETWKNLRIVFSRNLKKAPHAAKKKPYYLLESMRYLMPFMKLDNSSPKQAKSRSQATYCETTSDEHNSNRDEEEDYINSFNEHELEIEIKEEQDSSDETPRKKQKSQNGAPSDEIFIPETLIETPRKNQKTQDKTDLAETINQCDCSKPKTISSSSSRTDSKHQFLMSLLPDLDDMSEVQFRSFRLEVCKLINHTLTPQPPPPAPPSQFSGRNNSWTSFQYQPVVNLGNKHPETRNQHESEK